MDKSKRQIHCQKSVGQERKQGFGKVVGLRSSYVGTKECNTDTSNSKSMEGSQRLIDQSKPTTLSISECFLPQDYLQLKINSNDLYSKSYHPHNNCYSFVIEFDQPAAESLQYRINQCNRYQVISATVPIRSQLGV